MRGKGLVFVAVLATALGLGSYGAFGAPSAPTATTATTVNVTAGRPSEFRFTLSKKTVARGVVTFRVTNRGKVAHDFKIGNKKTRMLAPGRSQTLRVTLSKGKKNYLCTVAGHAAAGMKGTLTVR